MTERGKKTYSFAIQFSLSPFSSVNVTIYYLYVEWSQNRSVKCGSSDTETWKKFQTLNEFIERKRIKAECLGYGNFANENHRHSEINVCNYILCTKGAINKRIAFTLRSNNWRPLFKCNVDLSTWNMKHTIAANVSKTKNKYKLNE